MTQNQFTLCFLVSRHFPLTSAADLRLQGMKNTDGIVGFITEEDGIT